MQRESHLLIYGSANLPPLRGFGLFRLANPPLKRWAMIYRPSGTDVGM